MRFAWHASDVACSENVPRGTFVSIATDVLAICEELWASQFHSPTDSQFHKFQGLWNCGDAGSILLELAAQFHSFTGSQKLCFVELCNCGACVLRRAKGRVRRLM